MKNLDVKEIALNLEKSILSDFENKYLKDKSQVKVIIDCNTREIDIYNLFHTSNISFDLFEDEVQNFVLGFLNRNDLKVMVDTYFVNYYKMV